jgi:hypothetical protein
MEGSPSFQDILQSKMGIFSTENETSYIKNYVPGRYDIPVLGLKSAIFASRPQKNPYGSAEKVVAEPSIPVDEPKIPKANIADFSTLATVAYRTLSSLSEQGLGDSLSVYDLKSIKRKLSKRLHPDLGGCPDNFIKMLEAVDILNSEIQDLIELEQSSEAA